MNINIKDKNLITITVDGDKSRKFSFNPNDQRFAKRFYELMEEAEKRSEEYMKKAEELDKVSEVDTYGLPVNLRERMDLLSEICNDNKKMIDDVFGEGTSQVVFGDLEDMDMFGIFFEEIMPHLQKARNEKMNKYLKNGAKK